MLGCDSFLGNESPSAMDASTVFSSEINTEQAIYGVYNLMGQRIASTDARGGKIVLHDLEPGIYVVNGKKILVK